MPIYQNQINQHRSCQSGHSCNCRRPVPEPCSHPVSQKIQPVPAKPDCGCGIKDPLEDLPIAMAYVPWQRWRDLTIPTKDSTVARFSGTLISHFVEKEAYVSDLSENESQRTFKLYQ